MQNVELKAKLLDIELARKIAASIGASKIATLLQTDTYFRVPDGKLKKRETIGHPTEWILYHRPDLASAKVSNYTRFPEGTAPARFNDPNLQVWVIVNKSRELWKFEEVRIHFDTVTGLGTFLEFEAIVGPERTLSQAKELVDQLSRVLAAVIGESIAGGYSDLLAAQPVTNDSILD